MVVKRIKEGSGADLLKGEIGPGDRLLEIDDVVITGLSTSALAKLVLGKENTKARVKVGTIGFIVWGLGARQDFHNFLHTIPPRCVSHTQLGTRQKTSLACYMTAKSSEIPSLAATTHTLPFNLRVSKVENSLNAQIQKAAPSGAMVTLEIPRLARKEVDDMGSMDSMSSITSQTLSSSMERKLEKQWRDKGRKIARQPGGNKHGAVVAEMLAEWHSGGSHTSGGGGRRGSTSADGASDISSLRMRGSYGSIGGRCANSHAQNHP
jgi:hypothetical protein